MSPFSEEVRREIYKRDKYICQSCGKSCFDSEQWLIDAAHYDHTRNDNYDNANNGRVQCRVCHLLETIDLKDYKGANLLANRIWQTGIRHYAQYDKNPQLLVTDRIYLTELLTALNMQGKIHIDENANGLDRVRRC